MKRVLSGGAVLGLALMLAGCSASLISDTDNSDNDNTDANLPALVDLAQDPYTRATITWTEPAGTTGYELRLCEAVTPVPTWDQCPPAAEQPDPCGAGQACEQNIPNLGLNTYRAYLAYKVGSNRAEPASVDVDARFKLARYPGSDADRLGSRFALGDLDGDGTKDLAVIGFDAPARLFVFKGGRSFLRASAGAADPQAFIQMADMRFADVQIGNLTCSGRDDLLINGYQEDIWVSQDSTLWQGEVAVNASTFFRITGPDLAENPHLTAIADLMGNGCPEMVMGAPLAFPPDSLGELDHLFGGIDAPINDFADHYSDPLWRGTAVEQKFGYYVYNIGDVDAGGKDILLFASQYMEPGVGPENVTLKFFSHDGSGYVINPPHPPMLSIPFYQLIEERTIEAPGFGWNFGVFAGPLGDIDVPPDGVNDFFVTNLLAATSEVRIFRGEAGVLGPGTPDFQFGPEDFGLATVDQTFGVGMAADDFDHDGSIELLVGSSERIYVYRYNADAANYEAAETLPYPCAGIQVWDFNQDGYNDILCGNVTIGAAGAMDFRY